MHEEAAALSGGSLKTSQRSECACRIRQVFSRALACVALALLALLASGDGAQAAAACKCFVPVATATYSTTAPGSSPDISATLDLGLGPNGQYESGGGDDTGDYNFSGFVNFSPSAPTDTAIPNGALVGSIQATATLGVLTNPCTSRIEVPLQFMEATTDVNDVVHMLPFGQGNELAILAGDNPPFEGQQAVKPPPVVIHYPSYLNAIFDHDWVDYGADQIPGNGDDNNGPLPPIVPRFRAVATTWLSFASLWIIVQQVVFEPGTDLPNLPPFSPSFGYPSITVLQTSSTAGSATPPAPSAFTDFCTPLKTVGVSYGSTTDNPDTPGDEGGIPLRTLPAGAGAPITSFFYSFSHRDADGDGYENTLDPCPLTPDIVWDPRDPSRAGDSDMFAGPQRPTVSRTVVTPHRTKRQATHRRTSPLTTTVTGSPTAATIALSSPMQASKTLTRCPAKWSATASAMPAIRTRQRPTGLKSSASKF